MSDTDEYYLRIRTIQTSAIRILVEALKEILTDTNIIFDDYLPYSIPVEGRERSSSCSFEIRVSEPLEFDTTKRPTSDILNSRQDLQGIPSVRIQSSSCLSKCHRVITRVADFISRFSIIPCLMAATSA